MYTEWQVRCALRYGSKLERTCKSKEEAVAFATERIALAGEGKITAIIGNVVYFTDCAEEDD